MAANSLSPSRDAVSVTIPAAYVERFQDETLTALGSAAQTIEEIARWTGDARERGEEPKAEITAEDLQRYRDVELLFVEARAATDGDLTVTAGVKELYSAAVGCSLDVAESIKGEVEKLDPELDPVLAEFGFWRELRERLAQEVES